MTEPFKAILNNEISAGIVFRNADKSDLEALCKIFEKPYGGFETARRFVELYLDHYFWKLVESEGKIIGGLIWFPRESPNLGWAEILDLWIFEKYRRRGLGFRLVQEAIKDIKSYFQSQGHRARCIIVFASENNIPARRLYEKAGFKKIGYGGYVSDDGTKELLYSLKFQILCSENVTLPFLHSTRQLKFFDGFFGC